ncbi:MAG: thioesterase family protein [Chloroflexi bacterium]|nr:thioesterase family protein [Chloroflexota bacterium]
MKESLQAGISATVRYTIDEARTIDFMGEEGRVYATPELVRDIENTCRDLLLQHTDDGEDSVGVHIGVDHMAATLLGMWVEVTAEVTAVNGRRVTLDITARDNLEDVARGKHVRFVVDVQKSAARFRQKAEKVKAL